MIKNSIRALGEKAPKGTCIYSLVTYRSKTCYRKRFRFFVVNQNVIEEITFHVAVIYDYKRHNQDGGITMSGDGAELTFLLAEQLHGDGKSLSHRSL